MQSDVLEKSRFGSDIGRFIKILLYLFSCLILVFSLFLLLALFKISSYAFYTYDSYNLVPHNRVGVLLGTSSNISPGQPNDFFTNRIMAAATLYHKGKIDYILVSGDNRHLSYNEPREMTRALIKEGVPSEVIVQDYAGFRTMDSILRAKGVFLLDKFTIISQSFHNERALFIARENGMNAIAFNAADPASEVANTKVAIREFFARIMCVFDVYFFNSQPKFLGDPIAIGNAPLPKQPTDTAKKPTSKPKKPGFSVAGLKSLEIESFRAIAKQPTDSAFLLRQQEKAREHLQRTIAIQDSQLDSIEKSEGQAQIDNTNKAVEKHSNQQVDSAKRAQNKSIPQGSATNRSVGNSTNPQQSGAHSAVENKIPLSSKANNAIENNVSSREKGTNGAVGNRQVQATYLKLNVGDNTKPQANRTNEAVGDRKVQTNTPNRTVGHFSSPQGATNNYNRVRQTLRQSDRDESYTKYGDPWER